MADSGCQPENDLIREETLFWLSQPGIFEGIAQARQELAEGRTLSADEVRVKFDTSAN